eukprot:TRINITY_DN3969_c1_g1_i1.p1 TRINITY_DN3969_c1_g1~~TRINITY_DN3969_c1_g1_i1.p1  ORF type:complete len:226 (+),score=-28.29 TRINITY_DN3969_c1_g1_i1:37-678(+)
MSVLQIIFYTQYTYQSRNNSNTTHLNICLKFINQKITNNNNTLSINYLIQNNYKIHNHKIHNNHPQQNNTIQNRIHKLLCHRPYFHQFKHDNASLNYASTSTSTIDVPSLRNKIPGFKHIYILSTSTSTIDVPSLRNKIPGFKYIYILSTSTSTIDVPSLRNKIPGFKQIYFPFSNSLLKIFLNQFLHSRTMTVILQSSLQVNSQWELNEQIK